jgi:hypothetical protein
VYAAHAGLPLRTLDAENGHKRAQDLRFAMATGQPAQILDYRRADNVMWQDFVLDDHKTVNVGINTTVAFLRSQQIGAMMRGHQDHFSFRHLIVQDDTSVGRFAAMPKLTDVLLGKEAVPDDTAHVLSANDALADIARFSGLTWALRYDAFEVDTPLHPPPGTVLPVYTTSTSLIQGPDVVGDTFCVARNLPEALFEKDADGNYKQDRPHAVTAVRVLCEAAPDEALRWRVLQFLGLKEAETEFGVPGSVDARFWSHALLGSAAWLQNNLAALPPRLGGVAAMTSPAPMDNPALTTATGAWQPAPTARTDEPDKVRAVWTLHAGPAIKRLRALQNVEDADAAADEPEVLALLAALDAFYPAEDIKAAQDPTKTVAERAKVLQDHWYNYVVPAELTEKLTRLTAALTAVPAAPAGDPEALLADLAQHFGWPPSLGQALEDARDETQTEAARAHALLQSCAAYVVQPALTAKLDALSRTQEPTLTQLDAVLAELKNLNPTTDFGDAEDITKTLGERANALQGRYITTPAVTAKMEVLMKAVAAEGELAGILDAVRAAAPGVALPADTVDAAKAVEERARALLNWTGRPPMDPRPIERLKELLVEAQLQSVVRALAAALGAEDPLGQARTTGVLQDLQDGLPDCVTEGQREGLLAALDGVFHPDSIGEARQGTPWEGVKALLEAAQQRGGLETYEDDVRSMMDSMSTTWLYFFAVVPP